MPSVHIPLDLAVLARFFRVLGDPTRLRILALLEHGERTAGELVAAIGGHQPRISAHLACLRHCGFVEADRRGREIFYRLGLPLVSSLLEAAMDASAPQAERLASCSRIGPEWV
jgi:DNA-binding transcriptional ArsR family regulator